MARKKFKPVPLSAASNAYDLLTDVRRTVLEEPKRLNMGIVLAKGEEGIAKYLGEVISHRQSQRVAPACGTVGCVAGWSMVLAGVASNGLIGSDINAARTLLGLFVDQSRELFFPPKLVGATNKQTRAHARDTARHIRKFQAKYKTQLTRTPLARPVQTS